MGGLVQQSSAAGAYRQHPASRSRATLLRHVGAVGDRGVTQTKWPPENPGRFKAICGAQFGVFGAATRFQDFVEDLDLPTHSVPSSTACSKLCTSKSVSS